jgi:hypothetical protein
MRRINIAIASPGDLEAERELVPKIFTRWNDRNEHALLHPVMWEHTAVPELGSHPQSILNSSIIGKSDLLIAMLWTKLGTPTATASSGTLEEIREFMNTKGPKRVMLYFCIRDLPYDTNPLDIVKLKEFKSEMRSQGLYHEYSSVQQFESDIYRHLDAKVDAFLNGQLPIPKPEKVVGVGVNTGRSGATANTDLAPIEFGSTFSEIAAQFHSMMEQLQLLGAGPHKYLDLGANLYFSVANALDRYLTFSAMALDEPDRAVIASLSANLKRLASNKSQYRSHLPFSEFWRKGQQLAEDLKAHSDYVEQSFARKKRW